MAKMALKIHVRRQICTFAMGLGFAVSATQSGEAQTQNVAQQKMAQSILNFCNGGGQAQLNVSGPPQRLAQILCNGLGGMVGVPQGNTFGLSKTPRWRH
jgi:hypothetical protein